jgi:hypothetical protein
MKINISAKEVIIIIMGLLLVGSGVANFKVYDYGIDKGTEKGILLGAQSATLKTQDDCARTILFLHNVSFDNYQKYIIDQNATEQIWVKIKEIDNEGVVNGN